MPDRVWRLRKFFGRLPFTRMPFVFSVLGLVAIAGLGADAQTPPPATAQAAAAFEKIATVLQHPRCLNCHQQDTPLQTDAGRVHVPRVTRGTDNLGLGAMRCGNCHRDENNAASHVPGAPHWQLAPPSMKWGGLTVAELCLALKDKTLNGNRNLDAITEHVGHDKLVLWGWDPGALRATPPIGHKEFVDLVRVWVAGGGECPTGRPSGRP